MDSQDLKFPEDKFDVSVTNFGIFFFPDPAKGAKEIWRTLTAGGVASVTCWKEICFIPTLYEVQKVVRPAKDMVLDELESWRKKETMEQTLREGGFKEVEMVKRDVMMVQGDTEELVGNL